jgi:hypothetical protein
MKTSQTSVLCLMVLLLGRAQHFTNYTLVRIEPCIQPPNWQLWPYVRITKRGRLLEDGQQRLVNYWLSYKLFVGNNLKEIFRLKGTVHKF